jgi:restriction endonuclease
LIAIASVGRGHIFGVKQLEPKWHVHIAPLSDWIMLAADADCSALKLWKLGEHVAQLENYHTEFLNPSGLIALWGFWHRSDFWLAPKDLDIHNPRNLLSIGTDFGVGPRLEARARHDIHSVRSHDGTSWVSVQRLNPSPLFPSDEQSRVYADRVAAREQQLVGYVEGEKIAWWVIAPRIEASPHHRDVLFQLWECVLQWTDRASNTIQRELSPEASSIEIRIELPDFARWELYQKRPADRTPIIPFVEVHSASFSMTITLPEDFLVEFNQPKNVAEQAIVSALIEGVERLIGTGLTEARRKELVHEIVRNEDSRFFHILETQMVEHMVKPRLRARPMFIADEDLTSVQIGLAEISDAPAVADIIKGKTECQDFLQKIVEKLWQQVEQGLKPFSRRSIVAACFRAIDEISRDGEHWKMTTRSVLALQQELRQTKAVLAARSSQRSVASLANRILIETAQYSAGVEGGRQLNRAEHGQLLARVELLITMAHHHDAIAYGFLKPEVRINPRGDIEVDGGFYENVMRKYFSHRSDKSADQAAKLYDSYFDRSKRSDGAAPEKDAIEFDEVFQDEFRFSVRQLFQINELWRKLAIESGELAGVVEEGQMLGLLGKFAEMNREQSQHFLSRFTLPIRSGWDADLPPRCSKQDVFPWRFRRNLSVLMRPVVQVATNPSGWMVSAPLFEKSAQYLTGNIYEGRLPDRFFSSQNLRSYIGEVVHKHGHAFAEKVADVFRKNGYEAQTKVKMTKLGAPKNPDLGDIDVLAWRSNSEDIFLVEAKRLTPALTVREVIQRLEEFRGDEKANDSLRKHVRRIKWIEQNLSGIEKLTGIRAARIKSRPLLVTSESVPMQFFDEMKFPIGQVIPIDELKSQL